MFKNNPNREPRISNFRETPPQQLGPSEWVEVRLFISSTFIDTHSERDLLMKKVIPDVNRILKDQHIRIVPVDLRWGVVNDGSKDAEYAIQTLCLNEIDNCRLSKNTYAYFIGLRTDRYGWVQTKLADEDKYENPKLFSWVKLLQAHNKNLSITSLECIHAVWKREKCLQENSVFFTKEKSKILKQSNQNSNGFSTEKIISKILVFSIRRQKKLLCIGTIKKS